MSRAGIDRRKLLGAAALGLGGFAAIPSLAQGKPEKPRLLVAVGARASLNCLPLTVAERLGYFTAEGLEVELHDFASSLRALQAVQDGQGDIVADAFVRTISLQAKNQHFRAFALLARAPQVAFGVSIRTMPGYKEVANLRGRRLGVAVSGSSASMVANLVLLRHGVRPQEVQFVELASPAAALMAVRSGQIDAISHPEPVMTMLEHKSELRIVADTRSLKGSQDLFGGTVASACLYATAEFVDKHPNSVQGVTNAVVHALKWLQTAGPSDIIKVVPEAFLLGDRGLYLAAFNKVRETIAVDGVIPEEGARTALRTLARMDTTFKVEQIDLARTYSNDFARRAKARFHA